MASVSFNKAVTHDSVLIRGSKHQETFQEEGGELDEEEEEVELESFDDFTLATPWERFVAGVEGIIRQWQAAGIEGLQWQEGGMPNLSEDPWLHSVFHEHRYGAQSYGLSFFFPSAKAKKLKSEMGNGMTTERSNHEHPIKLLFGLEQFLILAPLTKGGVVFDSSEATLLLSTLACALTNSQCSWPGFIPVNEIQRQGYKGIQQLPGTSPSFHFEADRIQNCIPSVLYHLEGLYDFFAGKLVGEVPFVAYGDNPEVSVSMRLVYRTRSSRWEHEIDGSLSASTDEEGEGRYFPEVSWDESCPWGEWHSMEDPIRACQLTATWKGLYAHSSGEIAHLEMLSPFTANNWSLSVIPANGKEGNLEDWPGFASRLRLLAHSFEAVREVGRPHMDDFVSEDGRAALRKIGGRSYMAVPSQSVIQRVLKDLFSEGHKPETKAQRNEMRIKTAPPGSLLARLALHALRFGDCNVKAISSIWKEFRAEVHWYWDQTKPLPRVSTNGPPDFGSCLLHQKLQMLALCIRRKIEIEKRELDDRASDMHARHSKLGETLKFSDDFKAENVNGSQRLNGRREDDDSVSSGGTENGVYTEDDKMEQGGKGRRTFSLQESSDELENPGGGEVEDGGDGWERIEDLAALLPRFDSDPPRNEDSVTNGKIKSTSGAESSDDLRGSEVESESTVYESLPDVDNSMELGDLGEETRSNSLESGGEAQVETDSSEVNVEHSTENGAKGFLKPAGNLVLLRRPIRIFVPVVQDEVYLTEDVVKLREESLIALGYSPSAAEARAQVQGKSLSSDMSAFKAANPSAVLEDFIRWYSPKDWISESSPIESEETIGGGVESSRKTDIGIDSKRGLKEMVFNSQDEVSQKKITCSSCLNQGREREEVNGGEREVNSFCKSCRLENGNWILEVGNCRIQEKLFWSDEDRFRNQRERMGESEKRENGRANGEEVGVEEWPPRGHLSERMRKEGNLCAVLWEKAPSLSASEQKPLFDYEKEAQKALHFLDTIRPVDLISQILCAAFTASAHLLFQTNGSDLPAVAYERQRLIFRMEAILGRINESSLSQGETTLVDNFEKDEIQKLCDDFQKLEAITVAAASMWQKLGKSPRLVASLLETFGVEHENHEVEILMGNNEEVLSLSGDKVVDSPGKLIEQQIVANLFPPGTKETKKSKGGKVEPERMGNQFNGHEPMEREVIFECPMWPLEGEVINEDFEDANSKLEQEVSIEVKTNDVGKIIESEKASRHLHRMYTKSMAKSLQIAIAIGTSD